MYSVLPSTPTSDNEGGIVFGRLHTLLPLGSNNKMKEKNKKLTYKTPARVVCKLNLVCYVLFN